MSILKVCTQWWLGLLAYFIWCTHWSWILRCCPQKRHMNFLQGEKVYFGTLFPNWTLPSSSPVSSSDRLHFLLSSQWDISSNLSKANWTLERAQKALLICPTCCQTDAYPMWNKSTGYKRSIGNCFSTMIFKWDLFYNFSLEPLKLLNGLHCDALPRLCLLICCFLCTSSILFGDLVPYV